MRRRWSILIAVMLAIIVSISSLGAAVQAQPTTEELAIESPKIWDKGEAVTFWVTAAGQPVEGVDVYAFSPSRGEPGPEEIRAPWLIEYSQFLGTTDGSGELIYTFTEAGIYLLVAAKEGYVPGIARLIIRPSKSLDIQVSEEPQVGETVAITVADATTAEPVEGASVYALGREKAEKLARWLLGEMFMGAEGSATMMTPALPPSGAETEEYDLLIGVSDASGVVTHTFDNPGRYILIALKEGYAPGVGRLVLHPKIANALRIETSRQADVGESVTIKVSAADTGEAVQGAEVYLLHHPWAEIDAQELKETLRESLPESVVQGIPPQQMMRQWGKEFMERGGMSLPALPPEFEELLGTTDEKGEITYQFAAAGRYFLVARKEGYAPGFAPIHIGGNQLIEVESSQGVYFPGDTVIFGLENNTSEELTLSSSAPWQIVAADGTIVFAPIALMVITPQPAGQTTKWTWDQTDNEGNPVPQGKYEVVVGSSAGDYSATFALMSAMPLAIEAVPGQVKSLMIERGASGQVVFKTSVPATTGEKIFMEGSQLFVDTNMGAKAVKMMPDDVLQAKLRAQKVHKMELKVINEKPVYEIQGVARAKLFGLIPVKMKIKTLVDAQSGEVIKEKKPWWSFLSRILNQGGVSFEQA